MIWYSRHCLSLALLSTKPSLSLVSSRISDLTYYCFGASSFNYCWICSFCSISSSCTYFSEELILPLTFLYSSIIVSLGSSYVTATIRSIYFSFSIALIRYCCLFLTSSITSSNFLFKMGCKLDSVDLKIGSSCKAMGSWLSSAFNLSRYSLTHSSSFLSAFLLLYSALKGYDRFLMISEISSLCCDSLFFS